MVGGLALGEGCGWEREVAGRAEALHGDVDWDCCYLQASCIVSSILLV